MKVTNNTTFRGLPFRQIAARLENKLGRFTTEELVINLCCEEKKCKHGNYLLGSLSFDKDVPAGKIKKLKAIYLWFPQQHGHLASRDVAYSLDCLMRNRGIGQPQRIQDRVALVREYQWADAFPLGEVKPPAARPAKARPSEIETANRRLVKLALLIKKWKRERSAADYNVRKFEAEEKALLRKIGKEKPGAQNQTNK
jgi:hypothetical protein